MIRWLLIFLMLISCKTYEITTISSLREINFKKITPQTLVIFDVDYTLIYFPDIAFEEYKVFLQTQPGFDLEDLESLVLHDERCIITDTMIVDVIHDLQGKGIEVIACTGFKGPSHGVIKDSVTWRHAVLTSFGIDFSPAFSDRSGTYLRNALFAKGIIYSGRQAKGESIGLFLDLIKWTPKRIVFIDDNLKYMYTVQDLCKKRNIPFEGYHYIGAKSAPLDEKMAIAQWQNWLKNKKWISCHEMALLRKKA